MNLLDEGYKVNEIGYIKPVTQCESVQLIQKYCTSMGIECIGIGPIVFYSGFTRAYLNNETESSEELLQKILNAGIKTALFLYMSM